MGFIITMLVVIVAILLYIAIKNQLTIDEKNNDIAAYIANHKVVKDADEYYNHMHHEADDYYRRRYAAGNRLFDRQQEEVAKLEIRKSRLKDELHALTDEVDLEYVFNNQYDDYTPEDIKKEIEMVRKTQKDMVSNDEAVSIRKDAKEKILKKHKQQIIRCFDAEVSEILDNVTARNRDTSHGRISRACDTINSLFGVNGVQITNEYLETKFEELNLIVAHQKSVQNEKEREKEIREKLREDARVERECQEQKKQIEKDMRQFHNEVSKLMKYMNKSHNDVEKEIYVEKIKELEAKIKELEEKKDSVVKREQNAKAGFVYIISNVGSFGEDIYKIGMTRRLEPMDRIKELSSASVPFVFDVHALIFSENAPKLESTLHQYFDDKRVNKVNTRKEFYRVDLEEIKKVVLENHNATVHFMDIPDATEYRETLKLEKKLQPHVEYYSEKEDYPVKKKVVAKPVKVKVRPVVRSYDKPMAH